MDAQAGSVQRRALIVEDNKAVSKMLSLALRRGGFLVTVAEHSGEALRLMDEQPLDPVVLDLSMPDSGGHIIRQHLQSDPEMQRVTWLVMSTLDLEDIRRLYSGLEGHFVSKPFNP